MIALPRVFALLSLLPAALGAQGSVTGQLAILERPGARTTDLANAVVWLEPAGGSRNLTPSAAQIQMESRTFVPKVRVVPAGSTVEFPNQDPFRHNVFSKAGPRDFDLGLYTRGESRGTRFERAGVYPIFCNIHARMVAFVVAVPSPWVTRPSASGSFSLAGVPPGTYTLRAWHDRGGTLAREVVVDGAASPTPLALQLDARGWRFVQHRNKFGQEYAAEGRDRY